MDWLNGIMKLVVGPHLCQLIPALWDGLGRGPRAWKETGL